MKKNLIEDKSFDFVIKTPPAYTLLVEASKVKLGSAEPNRVKVGSVTWDDIKKIAEIKGLSDEAVAMHTTDNFLNLFHK